MRAGWRRTPSRRHRRAECHRSQLECALRVGEKVVHGSRQRRGMGARSGTRLCRGEEARRRCEWSRAASGPARLYSRALGTSYEVEQVYEHAATEPSSPRVAVSRGSGGVSGSSSLDCSLLLLWLDRRWLRRRQPVAPVHQRRRSGLPLRPLPRSPPPPHAPTRARIRDAHSAQELVVDLRGHRGRQ